MTTPADAGTPLAAGLWRTQAELADGREIVYYDEAPGRKPATDPRELPEPAPGCELRRDPLLDEWVGVAAHRNERTMLPPTDLCPLCPSRDGRQTEIPDSDYDVVVLRNRWPSFAPHTPDVEPLIDGEPLLARRPGRGACDVVCFTSDHDSAFSRLPVRRARTVIEAWADRTAAMSARPEVAQVFPFENRGVEIGVTLHHPHGQIYHYPYVTPRTARVLQSVRRHREKTGRNLFADILETEVRAGTRVVFRGEHWTAFVPAAARWPVEVHLYPHRHVPDLPALTGEERDELAEVYLDLLRRCDGLYDTPLPYVSGWHQAPTGAGREEFRLHLELFSIRRGPGKIKYLAGSESGMAAWINDVPPEITAERLRG